MTLEELIEHEEKESKATWNGKPTLCAEEHKQLAEWLKELKRLREQTSWIPVSEKLPKDGSYLVTVKSIVGEPRISIRSFAKNLNKVDKYDFPKHKCGWYGYDSEYGYWEDTDVMAWMPLPEPYKASQTGAEGSE